MIRIHISGLSKHALERHLYIINPCLQALSAEFNIGFNYVIQNVKRSNYAVFNIKPLEIKLISIYNSSLQNKPV